MKNTQKMIKIMEAKLERQVEMMGGEGGGEEEKMSSNDNLD